MEDRSVIALLVIVVGFFLFWLASLIMFAVGFITGNTVLSLIGASGDLICIVIAFIVNTGNDCKGD